MKKSTMLCRWTLVWCVAMTLLGGFPAAAPAAVEIGLKGSELQRLNEVYTYHGAAYLALDDILPALGLTGEWEPVEHVYSIVTPSTAIKLVPGNQYLRIGGQVVEMVSPARFIDGRLRVTEGFVREQLPKLAKISLVCNNLNPLEKNDDEDDDDPTERMFADLLRRKESPFEEDENREMVIAIDPGHGGTDSGTIGIHGVKEKGINLDMAQALAREIRMNMGTPVVFTRDKDYGLTRSERGQAITHQGADLVIVLHAQVSQGTKARGMTLFVRPQEASGRSWGLARKLEEALQAANLQVNGIYAVPLLPLGEGDRPTVMVEMGYLSNMQDTVLLGGPDMANVAKAMMQGIRNFVERR
ncbi:MAG: N-acetylmuramoyl-L-alanine amidase [Deltaproteobacteria bacterium]|nr:N-acetylmuramoyl-L-alanine amidase [Deltaproteobacteria bacterium]